MAMSIQAMRLPAFQRRTIQNWQVGLAFRGSLAWLVVTFIVFALWESHAQKLDIVLCTTPSRTYSPNLDGFSEGMWDLFSVYSRKGQCTRPWLRGCRIDNAMFRSATNRSKESRRSEIDG